MMKHIYLDNVRPSKMRKLIKKATLILNKDGNSPIFLHIYIDNGKTPIHLFRYAKINGIGGIEFIYRKRLPSKRTLRRIAHWKSIATFITYYLHGETLDGMRKKYKDSPALIYAYDKDKQFSVRARYDLRYKKAGYDNHLCCHFDSCLGNTIYYAKDGRRYFCPFYLNEKTLLKGPDDSPFDDSDSFKEIILKQISFRKECQKRKCQVYPLCQGGCPFDDDPCLFFKKSNDEKPFNKSPSLLDNHEIEKDIKDFNF